MNIITSIQAYVEKRLAYSDVWLPYDRYREYSLKGGTRGTRRQGDATYHLEPDSPLPGKKVMLSVTSNKVQLIDIICAQLPAKIQESQLCSGTSHSFFLVGPEPTVIEVKMGVVIERQDIRITHEEADTMIPNIAVSMFQKGMSSVHVIVEDTDVFVFLTHFYY